MINTRITANDEQFVRAYELFQGCFDETLLSAKASFEADFQWRLPDGTAPFVMLARSSAVPSDMMMAAISGCYLEIDDDTEADVRYSLGFIEYLAVHPDYRHGYGHGTALLQAFESEVRAIAAIRGDKLLGFFGEVEDELIPFKVNRGYRWPEGSIYQQPPIAFDPISGLPAQIPVTLNLMIKLAHSPSDVIDRSLLTRSVRTIYQTRYGVHDRLVSDEAHINVQTVLDHLLAQFAETLITSNRGISLINERT